LPWFCQAAWPLHHLLRNARKKALQRKKVPAGAEEIVAAAPGSCLIDGEVVACDEMGSPYSTGSGKDEKLRDAGRVRPARDSPGFHKIAAQFGVATGTVQRIAAG
jgi:hypothetical protein